MVNILVVDDSPSIRCALGYTLRVPGWVVMEAGDGLIAMDIIKTSSVEFQCIIADIHMPNMNGFDLVKNVRNLPDYNKTPIIVLTSDLTAHKKTQIKKLDINGLMRKPFLPDKTISLIKSII